MNYLACPNCLGDLKIEHYSFEVEGNKTPFLSSRLSCGGCGYKKEPKELVNNHGVDIEKIVKKEGVKYGKRKKIEDTTNEGYYQD